jgi:hypothetical protein
MFSKRHILSASLVWLLPLAGCFLRTNTVIEKFAGEFRCPKEQIKWEQPDKNNKEMFRASGCNRRANYRCTGDYGEFCERVGQPETINPEGMIDVNTPIGGANTSAPTQQKPPEEKKE